MIGKPYLKYLGIFSAVFAANAICGQNVVAGVIAFIVSEIEE